MTTIYNNLWSKKISFVKFIFAILIVHATFGPSYISSYIRLANYKQLPMVGSYPPL